MRSTSSRLCIAAVLLAGGVLAHGAHKHGLEDAGWSLHRAYELLFPFTHPAANARESSVDGTDVVLATTYVAS